VLELQAGVRHLGRDGFTLRVAVRARALAVAIGPTNRVAWLAHDSGALRTRIAVSIAERFDIVALCDLQGKFCARVRVPTAQGLPEIILWGNRYFAKSLPYGNYREGRVYLVPLQDMHGAEPAAPATTPGGPKK
jgi:hypothetical protein